MERQTMTEKEAYEQYESSLDCEGAISIGSLEFYPSKILRELDPIAYQVGFNEWCDSEGIDTDDLE